MKTLITALLLSSTVWAQSPEEALHQARQKSNQGAYEQAVTLLEGALQTLTGRSSHSTDTLLIEVLHQLGVNHSRLWNDAQAISYWKQELEILNDSLQRARVLRNIGNSYSFLGRFRSARDSLQKSLQIHLALREPEARLLGNTYKDLGYVFTEMQDWQQAEEHLRQAAQVYEQDSKNNLRSLGILYGDMYFLAQQRSELDSALAYSQRSLTNFQLLATRTIEDTFAIANQYHNVGMAYYQWPDSLQQSERYLRHSLAINKQHTNQRKAALANNYNDLSLVNVDLGNYAQAEQYIFQAITLNEEEGEILSLADNYNNLAELQLATERPKAALTSINTSLDYLLPNFAPENPLANHLLSDSAIIIGDQVELFRALADKGRILWALASQEDSSYISEAVATYQQATDLLNNIRTDFGAVQSKRFFTASVHPILEQAMLANLRAYQIFSGDATYLSNIVLIMELSRAVSLLDELQSEQAQVLAEIPDSLLAR